MIKGDSTKSRSGCHRKIPPRVPLFLTTPLIIRQQDWQLLQAAYLHIVISTVFRPDLHKSRRLVGSLFCVISYVIKTPFFALSHSIILVQTNSKVNALLNYLAYACIDFILFPLGFHIESAISILW